MHKKKFGCLSTSYMSGGGLAIFGYEEHKRPEGLETAEHFILFYQTLFSDAGAPDLVELRYRSHCSITTCAHHHRHPFYPWKH